jgi:hypothetical protein
MTAPAEYSGTDILVTIAGIVVGSQRGAKVDEKSGEIDLSSKNSRGKRFKPGAYESTLSLDSLFVPTTSGYNAMRAAMRNGTTVLLGRSELGVSIETADAIVTSLSEDFPDQGPATVAASFRIDGFWTPVTP